MLSTINFFQSDQRFLIICLLFMSVKFGHAQSNQNILSKRKDISLPYSYEFTKTSAKFTQSGYPVFMNYQIDNTKTPIWIDFTIKQGGRLMKLPGLMKWKTKDTLWIQQFPPYPKHPTKFDIDSVSVARKIHILVKTKK